MNTTPKLGYKAVLGLLEHLLLLLDQDFLIHLELLELLEQLLLAL
jgi:hypothetical protein